MKRKIDKEIYDELTNIMIKCSIPLGVFEIAKKMNIDLPSLFYEKLILNSGDKYKEQLSKNLLGIYGNFFATNYFKGLGYDVINEFPIYDEKNNIITKADLYFKDKNGIDNYCEVKTTHQIIDNIRNYMDNDIDGEVGKYVDKDDEIIKYKNIGKKLIKQVGKLSLKKSKVNVIVFNGCYIDSVILSELNDRDVGIIYMAINIDDLENYINHIIEIIDCTINEKRTLNKLSA